MLAIIMVFCFVKPFLPLADNCVRGDIFCSIFGKGSDNLHSGVLKRQLKMKINNLGVEKGDTANINPSLRRLGMALGQNGD